MALMSGNIVIKRITPQPSFHFLLTAILAGLWNVSLLVIVLAGVSHVSPTAASSEPHVSGAELSLLHPRPPLSS